MAEQIAEQVQGKVVRFPGRSAQTRMQTMQTTTPFGKDHEGLDMVLKQFGLNLTGEAIRRNEYELRDVLEDFRRCQACPGRENCPTEGWVRVPRTPYGPTRVVLYAAKCAKDEAYQRAKRTERLLKSSRLPEHFRDKTFETFRVTQGTQEAYELARIVADDPEAKGLLLAGPTGVGKTHLAAAVVNHRLKQGRQALFCTVPELLDDIRRVISSDEDTSELMELVKEAKLLVLDDLGAERTTEWVVERLFVLINARLMARRQTVVTTNYTSTGDLIEKLGGGLQGQRIVSRLWEMCTPVKLSGPDGRLMRG